MAERMAREVAWIPTSVAPGFDRVAALDGYTPAFLLGHWELAAVAVLQQGRGDLLPEIVAHRYGQVGPTKEYRFTRGPAESARCRQVQAEAGIDRNDLLRTAVGLYVAAGGMQRMRWITLPSPL